MIGLKLPSRKRARDEAEKPFWISFADLMTALMVLFLVSVTVALFAVTQKPDEVAKQQAQRERDIQALLSRISEATKAYPGIVVRGHSIDFGSRANFETGSSALSAEQATTLRAFVPKVLSVVRDPLGQKWLKRIVVEGFADQRGTYIYNLNLSLQRSERVLCVLLASPKSASNALTDADRLQTRELFLVGGSSFNALKASLEESRRIELKLEFLELDENRLTPRDAPLDDASCPLDL
ncbi:OmpA family protein [Ferrovum myxofaciens]|uniref:OmpA family protein n=1 Tax=Ferrovum myxofaciens TaxID=416213 RepID=A0A149VWL7_9PROT|nr:OmpA family protein [Ferrovum myxofaciens]KXW57568.1 OmpA family protein [Ferrovum myxofaciens]